MPMEFEHFFDRVTDGLLQRVMQFVNVYVHLSALTPML